MVLTIHLDDRDYQEVRRIAALMAQSEEECLREVLLRGLAEMKRELGARLFKTGNHSTGEVAQMLNIPRTEVFEILQRARVPLFDCDQKLFAEALKRNTLTIEDE